MKTNTDRFANLYFKPRRQKGKVKALLNGTRLPGDVSDLLRTAFDYYWRHDDEAAAFYLIEMCEAVQRYLGDENE